MCGLLDMSDSQILRGKMNSLGMRNDVIFLAVDHFGDSRQLKSLRTVLWIVLDNT